MNPKRKPHDRRGDRTERIVTDLRARYFCSSPFKFKNASTQTRSATGGSQSEYQTAAVVL